jgi:hypothetical protein
MFPVLEATTKALNRGIGIETDVVQPDWHIIEDTPAHASKQCIIAAC